jgi:uncharacterized repeat protein (TIGR03803 family)
MRKLNVLIIIVLLFLGFGKAGAQFKNLLLFDTTNAEYPQCHLDIVGNVMFGMTEANGTYFRGTVFSIHKDGSQYKSLHSFSDTDGAYPFGSVLVSGKKIYGMTHAGGLNDLGVIFSMDTDGTGFKKLYDFDFTYGENPFGNFVISPDGKTLYGTTEVGGIYNSGNVFAIDTDGTNIRNLHSFSYNDGAYLLGSLTLSPQGQLFGQALIGGINLNGVVYTVDTGGNNFKVLHLFNDTAGSGPYSDLTLIGNVLYGTTYGGGAYGDGVIFSVDTDGANYRDMHEFNGTDGENPLYGSMQLWGSKLYGTTWFGGGSSSYGVLYTIDTSATGFKDILNFTGPNGIDPYAGVVLSGNLLYGTTQSTIFSFDTNCTLALNMDYNFSLRNVGCYGEQNGSITASPAGGKGAYTYSWSDGETTSKITGLTAGTYSVTVTDSLGQCSQTASVNITAPSSAFTGYSIVTNNVTCYGDSNGCAASFASGGTPYFPSPGDTSYYFSWYDTVFNYLGGSNSMCGLKAGKYYAYIQDNNGCYVFDSVIITQPAQLNAVGNVIAEAGCAGSTGNASLSPSGGGSPYTYSWVDSTSTIVSTSNPTGAVLAAGSYTATVLDNCGNSATTLVTITSSGGSLSITPSVISNVNCYGGNTGNAMATVGCGQSPYTYSWSNGTSTVSTNSPTGAMLTAGSYTVTVTDANSSSATASIAISQPATFLLANASETSNVLCYNSSTGVATSAPVGGTSPYTYLWSNSTIGAVASNLSAGTYTLLVTDNNGCTAIGSTTISQPAAFSVGAGVISNATCYGSSNGRTTVTPAGGTSPYTYSWVNSSHVVISTGQSTPAILSAGSYTVTAHDNCGNSATASTSITQPKPIRDSIVSATAVGCNGGNGGSAKAGVKGGTYPYNYTWSNSSTLAIASGLSAGSYTVTITDKDGCSASTSAPVATITQPNALVESLSGIAYPECNLAKGSATVAVSGGTSPYTYTWTGALSTTATCTKLTAGSYTVTAKDKYSCSATLVITITQPLAIRDTIVSSAKLNVSCNGANNGSATVGVKYGTAPYTFTWTPNVSTTATASGLSAGTYSITVTDKNGCSSSVAKVTITQPATALTATIGSPICSNNLVKATVTPAGGTGPYTYSWSPGGGTKAAMSGLSQGVYTVTVTDAHGCTYNASKNLICGSVVLRESVDGIDTTAPQCCGGLENINLYPNPNSGQFTLSGLEPGMILEMYDYTGRKINSQFVIRNSQLVINISDQSNGIYLIRIMDRSGKLISQKKAVKTN